MIPKKTLWPSRRVAEDKLATAVITIVGLSVVAAVIGMMFFLLSIVWPVFLSERLDPLTTQPQIHTPFSYVSPENNNEATFMLSDANCHFKAVKNGNVTLDFTFSSGVFSRGQSVSNGSCFGLNSDKFVYLESDTQVFQLPTPHDELFPNAMSLAKISGQLTRGSRYEWYRIDSQRSMLKVYAPELVDVVVLIQKSNEITGVIDSSTTIFSVAKSPGILDVAYANDRLWAIFKDATFGAVSPDGEFSDKAHLPFAGIVAAAKSEKGDSWVLATSDNLCASFDIGKASRNLGTVNILWTEKCAAKHILTHPTKHIAAIWDEQSIQMLDIISGRSMFEKTWADLDNSETGVHSANIQPELGFGPKGLMLHSSRNGRFDTYAVVSPYEQISLRTLFSKVWYEGFDRPSFTWQSSSGTDDFQPKFSLVPLIWGTAKATLFAMLFAIPIALFAAIYSSEFLDRKTRNVIKPTIEMMASLPSVVIGYIASTILAPWLESHILVVLIIGVSTPVALHLWGNVFGKLSLKQISSKGMYTSNKLLILVLLGFCLTIFAFLKLAHFLEVTWFAGDIRKFLGGGDQSNSSEVVLWCIVLLPIVIALFGMVPVRKFRGIYIGASLIVAPVVTFVLGKLLASTGASEAVLTGFTQRNTLVIAIAMGFAVIPIIYSIAEDSLTSVPAALRAASLACGASIWQTTRRVVLPMSASGLFSAIMVGLGRAMGETMIIMMATGNTALISLNPFEGLRSLSANIAVELPEAPQGSSHYRVLFLSALILFCFTFVLNSVAESLRSKFRERNKGL